MGEEFKICEYMKYRGTDLGSRPELIIAYDSNQRKLYFKKPDQCINEQWDKPWGIHKTGKNFPVMMAKRYFEDLGYKASVSGSANNGYALIRYNKSRHKYNGYKLSCDIFGVEKIDKVLWEAENKGIKGGDPDIFVYDNRVNYFVEVKENDDLKENQKTLISIIEEHLCSVIMVRTKSDSQIIL